MRNDVTPFRFTSRHPPSIVLDKSRLTEENDLFFGGGVLIP